MSDLRFQPLDCGVVLSLMRQHTFGRGRLLGLLELLLILGLLRCFLGGLEPLHVQLGLLLCCAGGRRFLVRGLLRRCHFAHRRHWHVHDFAVQGLHRIRARFTAGAFGLPAILGFGRGIFRLLGPLGGLGLVLPGLCQLLACHLLPFLSLLDHRLHLGLLTGVHSAPACRPVHQLHGGCCFRIFGHNSAEGGQNEHAQKSHGLRPRTFLPCEGVAVSR
mmetsp:Transcript_121575/g.289017  ORF Transcript_121575/g.289017 Transcript_121575/m.289017 type:complete len:218 (-) Transcript_121575:42-695(-)